MTETEQLRSVLQHKPDTATRILRHCAIGRVPAHQGDVYLTRVPDDHPRGAPWGSRQVAVGQAVGQRHVAVGDVEVFAGVDVATVLPLFDERRRQACMGPVVVARGTWTLEHPEHAHHVLPAGVYQVTYQWDVARMGRVLD